MAQASAEALKNAASNENGAMAGFMGMNMANGAGASLMGTVNQGNTSSSGTNDQTSNTESSIPKFCTNCGAKVSGKFCSQCGTKTGL